MSLRARTFVRRGFVLLMLLAPLLILTSRTKRNAAPFASLPSNDASLRGAIATAAGPAAAGERFLPLVVWDPYPAPAPQPSPTAPPPQPSPTAPPRPTPPSPSPTPPAPPPPGELPAFPGAEGFGTATHGGRGGRIIYVTTLADSGPGSLRAALEASGPRLVLFQVAGTIALQDDVTIGDPFVTVAGQTAPGEGVQVKGGAIKVRTHDVVIRYLKLRPGDEETRSSPQERDAISISGREPGETYNVVVDHSSLVWGPDIGGPAILAEAHDVTIQNSIVGEGLYLSNHPEAKPGQGGHSMGANITANGANPGAYPERITLHHNLITTSDARMPQVTGAASVDIVNNVIYNWGKHPPSGNPRSLNFVKNMLVKGPETETLLVWEPHALKAAPDLFPQSVFAAENVADGFAPDLGGPSTVYAPDRFSPYSIASEQTPEEAYRRVVEDAGAVLPVRDAVDRRIVDNLVNRTGRFLNGSDLAWPELAPGTAPTDADLDGMPDGWEQQYFGDTSRGSPADSSGDLDGDGYTDVEEYLNGTDPSA